MKLFVKKLWSGNPDLYIYIELNKAENHYEDYLNDSKQLQPYSFQEWLKYEIWIQPKVNQKCNCCGGRFK